MLVESPDSKAAMGDYRRELLGQKQLFDNGLLDDGDYKEGKTKAGDKVC